MIKKFLVMAFMLCVCTAIFAQRTVVDTTNYVFNYAVKYTTDEELSRSGNREPQNSLLWLLG